MSDAALRDARPGDAAAIADFLNAVSRRLHGEAEVDADEVSAWLREPTIEFVLAERDGAIVGYGDVGHDEGRPHILWLDVRHAGDTAALGLVLDELERRARSRPSPPELLRGYVDALDRDEAAAFAARGFTTVRASFRMLRLLDGAVETEPLPDGLELRPYRAEDAEAVYEANMDSFADHWGFHRGPFDEWRRWTLERPGTDTSLFHLAWAGDELAGISLCRRHSTEEPNRGWVSTLGVRPPWRRRGLARALLLESFAEFARRGYDSVGLGVDAENTTGAVRLYERAGMHVQRRFDLWERRA